MGLLSGITKAAGSLLGGDTLKDVGASLTTYICQVRKKEKRSKTKIRNHTDTSRTGCSSSSICSLGKRFETW